MACGYEAYCYGQLFHILAIRHRGGGVGFVPFGSVASTHLVSDTRSSLLLRSMYRALYLGIGFHQSSSLSRVIEVFGMMIDCSFASSEILLSSFHPQNTSTSFSRRHSWRSFV